MIEFPQAILFRFGTNIELVECNSEQDVIRKYESIAEYHTLPVFIYVLDKPLELGKRFTIEVPRPKYEVKTDLKGNIGIGIKK